MSAVSIFLVWAALGQLGDAAPAPGDYPSQPPGGDPTFALEKISAEKDSILSTEVDGVLTQLSVKEGTRLELDEVFATINDDQARAAVDVADYTYQAAFARAEDTIEEIYAKASAAYAKVDLQKDQLANMSASNAVPDIQIREKELAYKRALLQTEKAQKDRVIAGKEADVKKAELKAAKMALDRRTLRAPFAGEVQQVFQKENQWVKAGDPVLRLVKFDVLRAECTVLASQFDPVELAGRPVTVSVQLARNRTITAPGRVVYVSQTVDPVIKGYLVRAEIENQREGDFWLIRPGLEAQMTVHVSQPPVGATAQQASRP